MQSPLPDGVRAYAQMLKPTMGFVLAWAFLNALLNLNFPAKEPNLLAPLLPSPEIAVLLSALCIAVGLGMEFHRAVYLALTVLLLFFRFFRTGDVLVPMYFNRTFNVYIDSRYVPDLVHLLYHTLSLEAVIAYGGLAITILAAASWGIWRSLKTVHCYFRLASQRYIFLGLVAVLASLSLFHNRPNDRVTIFAKGFFHRVVEEVDFILHVQGYRTEYLEALRVAAAKAKDTPASLDRLHGANVHLIFVESYGYTVFADSNHFSMIATGFEELEKSLGAKGFAVYSNFLTSPTYGGSSWLAHATLASGVNLDSQLLYNLLVTSNFKTIALYFNEAGYRTISAMPGTTWPWPEGSFFGYKKKYYAWNFDYKGPRYGWSPMPDQYVLDYIHRHEIRNHSQPLFIEYVLITSHAPFHLQPPYLEDWSQIGDGAIYHEKETITYPIVWPDLSNAGEAFMASINYEFQVLGGYLEQYIQEDGLIIILGDHQPNVQITGENRPWSVPIHVISRNRDLLKPFAARGFTPGLIPKQPPPHLGMETFLYAFLEDFSTPPRKEAAKDVAGVSVPSSLK